MVITLRSPMQIPGMVLPAGVYVFKLAESDPDRNIVEVFNTDESHLYSTFLAIPAGRLPANQSVERSRANGGYG